MNLPMTLAGLAGARSDILTQTPNDTPKYAAMGGVIVSTAALATLSATYALTTSVGLPVLVALFVGLGWGLVVLNLDRMLVVGMGRERTVIGNLVSALPRVLLAVVIGTVISMPIVLRIFQPEIDNELVAMRNEDRQLSQTQIERTFAQIGPLQAEADRLRGIATGQTQPSVADDPDVQTRQREYDQANSLFLEADREATCENQGTGCLGGSGAPGQGSLYDEKRARADGLRAERDAAGARLDQAGSAAEQRIASATPQLREQAQDRLVQVQAELDRLNAERDRFETSATEAVENGGGLLARLEALDRLSDDRPMMHLAHGAVFLLFFLVELLPVIVKLMFTLGRPTLYERLLARREDEAWTNDGDWNKHQAEINDERARVRLELERDRAQQQIDVGKAAMKELADTQRAISSRAVSVWGQVAHGRSDAELAQWYRQQTGRHLPPTGANPSPGLASSAGGGSASWGARTVIIPTQQPPGASPSSSTTTASIPKHASSTTPVTNGHSPLVP